MKHTAFMLKSPEENENWLREAVERFDQEDLNHILSIAWMLGKLEDFIFDDTEIAKRFRDHMLDLLTSEDNEEIQEIH